MHSRKLKAKAMGKADKTMNGYAGFACEHGHAWYRSGEEVFGMDKCDGSKLYDLIPNEMEADCIECGALKGEPHIWPCTREACPHCRIRGRIGCMNKMNRELVQLLLELRDLRAEIRLGTRKNAERIYPLEF